MRPLLTPAHYTSADWHAQEKASIFGKLWILAAIKPMLANHNDFRTLTLAGKPVVLQNHQGVIRAFGNVCRHRMARIQSEEFGNRPLVCPYHQWRYGECGQLTHTHRNPTVFGFTAQETSSIRLERYAVAIVGALVFVNLCPEPPPLETQFHRDTLDLLEKYTREMDSSFIYTRYAANFNWKVGMENIKDPLHVSCLHKSTFPSYFRIDIEADAALAGRDSVYRPHSTDLRDATPRNGGAVSIQDAPEYDWKQLVHRLDCQGRYQTFHLFPNVNLMIVDGSSFAIQIYNPLEPDRTEIQMLVALTRPVADLQYKPLVLWEHLASDMTVLQEDIDCLEALQKNLGETQADFVHGAYEKDVLDFQASYLAQLRSGTAGKENHG